MSDEPATDTLEPARQPSDAVAPERRPATPPTMAMATGGWSAAARAPRSSTSTARSSPGSSAFIMGRTARSAGLVPTRQFAARRRRRRVAFKLRGRSDKKTDGVRDRMLGAVTGMRQDDLIALNAEVLPKLLAKIRPEARRLLDLHRHAGRNTYIVSAAPVEIVEPLAHSLGHDGRHRHPRRGRRTGSTTASSTGPFCYGEGKVVAMEEIGALGRPRPRASATPTRTRPATCRCCRRSATRSPSTRTPGWPATPAPTAGRSSTSASAPSR